MRVAVAMSGGVDSSVAASLLVDLGHDVVGLSMQLYDQSAGDGSFGSCCSLDDLYDARRVAAAIRIPHYILNLERQFDDHVVANFVREYSEGRTPLPCARCNSDLKFATLVDRARAFGADFVATGHYARVRRDEETGRFQLVRGVDASKDQSYFLFSLTQAQLSRAVFPIGEMPKAAVRDYARTRSLAVAEKPDSQEICFVPDHDYARFVERRAPESAREGDVVDESGRVMAHHTGIHAFTVGQRKGLGLANSPTGAPMYVLALRPDTREVVIGPRSALERTVVTASEVNWMAGEPPGSVRVSAQIRYRHHAAPAVARSLGAGRVEVAFDAPQVAVTPGQALVMYDGDVVVGGGWID